MAVIRMVAGDGVVKAGIEGLPGLAVDPVNLVGPGHGPCGDIQLPATHPGQLLRHPEGRDHLGLGPLGGLAFGYVSDVVVELDHLAPGLIPHRPW